MAASNQLFSFKELEVVEAEAGASAGISLSFASEVRVLDVDNTDKLESSGIGFCVSSGLVAMGSDPVPGLALAVGMEEGTDGTTVIAPTL
jgi:hypothetical protein